MRKDLIIAAAAACTITLATTIPFTIHYRNKSKSLCTSELSPKNHVEKSINMYTKELEITTSEAATAIMQYFKFQDLNPNYANKNIVPSFSKIPFYDIPVKKYYIIKTSLDPNIQTIFLDKENLDILYNYLYTDLVKIKQSLGEELNLMYLNKKPINSSSMLKDFIEKYSLFNDIKDYKKANHTLYGALIIRYGDIEKEGKYRYSHEYFFKKD